MKVEVGAVGQEQANRQWMLWSGGRHKIKQHRAGKPPQAVHLGALKLAALALYTYTQAGRGGGGGVAAAVDSSQAAEGTGVFT